MYQAWIVCNRPKLTKAAGDKFFHSYEEAELKCKELNETYGNVWTVYEIRVDFVEEAL